MLKKVELLRGGGDRLVGAPDLASGEIHHDVCIAKGAAGPGRPPAKQRPDARQELLISGGLYQGIVGAAVPAPYPVGPPVPRRGQQNRNGPPRTQSARGTPPRPSPRPY